jgi:hypothetical protein
MWHLARKFRFYGDEMSFGQRLPLSSQPRSCSSIEISILSPSEIA